MIFPSVVVAGGRLEIEYQTLLEDRTNGLNTYTFTGVPFGDEGGKRFIVIYANMRYANYTPATAVTIGGVTATQLSSWFWGAFVPTGTTGTVTIYNIGVGCNGGIISVWRVKNLRTLAGYDAAFSTNSASIDVPTGGGVLGCSTCDGTVLDWTELTDHGDITPEVGGRFSAASKRYPVASTITINVTDNLPSGANPIYLVSLR